jgi:hypothetical protein
MIDNENVFDIFALAQTYNLPRLEDAVVAHFAMNIDEMLPLPQVGGFMIKLASNYSVLSVDSFLLSSPLLHTLSQTDKRLTVSRL